MQKKKILSLAIATATVVTGLVGVTTATTPTTPTVDPTNGDITICGTEYISDSNGSGGCITIQGKNVGATTTGAGPSAPDTSYGNYYQRGDNTPRTETNWLTNYSPSDDAWGGGEDGNELVYPVENESERQGPCDPGYHVPSKGEWYALMDMWADSSVNGYIYSDISQFYTAFQIPFAGIRFYDDGSLDSRGDDTYLWSSSPIVGDELARYFYMYEDYAYADNNNRRTYGFPVRCFKDSDIGSSSSETGSSTAQIILSVAKGILRIGNTDSILNLGEVNVSNNAQELSGSFGANSFWVEDMKGVESGYRTTISVTDLNGTVSGHSISANNVSLKTAGGTPSYISGASVEDSQVVFGSGMTSWHNDWTAPVTYFNRQNTPSNLAGRVGKWGDNLQIKVNIPAHTPYDTYRGTITYTLYDLDS